ncbi:hypothetical protein NDU88_005015, partial [Pleurodeles waltl]
MKSSRYNLETRDKGITFHRFPKSNPSLLDKWRIAMKRATSTGELWMPSRYQRLCSLHFEEKCFDTTGQTKRLRDDVIPSIFNFEHHLKPKQRTRTVVSKRPASESRNVPSKDLEVDHNPINTCASISQDHIYSMPDAETLKRKMQDNEEARPHKERELEITVKQEQYGGQTWSTMYNILTEKGLTTAQLNEVLLSYRGIPMELFKRPVSDYSVDQRLFALTLHLYGPKAYEYLGHELKLPLPGPKKLQSWLKTVDASPGINISFLEALSKKKKEKPELYSYVCLKMGTMAIRQHVSYHDLDKTVLGFTNFGKGAEANGIRDIATEVLVLMVAGIAGDWNVPVAYFLTKPLPAEAMKQLVIHALNTIYDFGFEVLTLTVDQKHVSEQVCSLLGCNFTDPKELKSCFSIPGRNQKCHVLFDASEELELMCSMLKTGEVLKTSSGTITWQYIEELQNMLKGSVFSAHRKSAGRHSQLFSQVVSIALSVQLLSKSTATVLKTLNELKFEKFADCMATVHFIQVVSSLYEIMTSNSPRIENNKGPINGNNLQDKLNILQEARDYMLSLTVADDTPLLESSRKRVILGFLVNISSLSSLLPRLLMVQKYVLLQKCSQDPLRMFFSRVQRAGGWAHAPVAADVKQVISLLLRSGTKGGCRESILSKDERNPAFMYGEEDIPVCFQQKRPMPFHNRSIVLPDHHYSSRVLQSLLPNSEVYIAGCVVQKALCRISCDTCRNCLVTEGRPSDFTNAYHLMQLKGSGVYFVPSEGTTKTVLAAQRVVRHMLHFVSPTNISILLLIEHEVLSNIGNKDVFNLKQHILETESGINNHHYQLIRLLTSIYYVLHKPYLSRMEQLKMHKRHTKQTLLKT